jgi:hypothetical protein
MVIVIVKVIVFVIVIVIVKVIAFVIVIVNVRVIVIDAESTRRMFLRERKARVNYNACIQSDCARPVGSFFDDED